MLPRSPPTSVSTPVMQLLVPNIVILLCRGQFPGEIGTRVYLLVLWTPLGPHSTNTCAGGVNLDNELELGVRVKKEKSSVR